MTLPRLVLVGAGGLGREVAEVVRAINRVRPTWDLIGFLDDAATRPDSIDGLPVIGDTGEVASIDAQVLLCVASPRNPLGRQRLAERLRLTPDRFATVIHPAADLPQSAVVGPGTMLFAGVVATSGVTVGAHVVAMPGVVLTHDDVVGDFVTLAAGVLVAGGVRIEVGAYLGAGSRLREHVQVGAGACVGMGAVVLGDVPPGEVWVGVPACRLRVRAVER
jgi:sugar O-acyltransferase (sialic acid O-acetyltransferase NeuD family)